MRKQLRRRGTSKTHASSKPNLYATIDWEKAATLFTRRKEEQRAQQEERAEEGKERTKRILAALAAAGTIGLIFAFPPIVPVIGAAAGLFRHVNWRQKRTIGRLRRQRWVTTVENPDGTVTVRLTTMGMTRALTYALDDMIIKKPEHWDKKWRVVIFDIPEKYKRLRDVFRLRLGQLGLTMLQESVFVSPYPCFDEIEFLRQLYGVSFSVRYLLVERVEDDAMLREHFQLS